MKDDQALEELFRELNGLLEAKDIRFFPVVISSMKEAPLCLRFHKKHMIFCFLII